MRWKLALALAALLLLLALAPASSSAKGADTEYVVSGKVQDLVGVPMMGVTIAATSVVNGSVFTCLSGGQGLYNLSLPAGTYNLSASIASFESNITYHQLLVDTDVPSMDFTVLTFTGTVVGHVISGDAPVIGAQIVLSNLNVTYVGRTSLPLGEYMITGVIADVFVARAERIGYWTNVSQMPVFVTQGELTELDFVLEPQPARLFGQVTVGSEGEEGVQVALVSGGSTVKFALTDVNGNYSLSNIIAGDYQVVFEKEGLVDKTYPVSISPFEDRELSVSMSPEQVRGGQGFIDDLDLTHSMMVVGLIVAMMVMLFAFFILARARKKPGLLAREEEEEAEPHDIKEK